jgi:hypothetical protein
MSACACVLARVGIKLQVARYTSTRTVPDLVNESNEDLQIVFLKFVNLKYLSTSLAT